MKIVNFANSGLSLEENSVRFVPQDWVNFLVSIGGLSRIKKLDTTGNIVTIVTLPSRNFASGFVALGAMLQGALAFEDKLSWNSFRVLPLNTEVYFKEPGSQKKYSGSIVEFTRMHDDEFITLKVLKPTNVAKKGITYSVSRSEFDRYSFSIEQPLSDPKADLMKKAAVLYKRWLVEISPKWIESDGAECLIVGTLNELKTRYKSLLVTSHETSSVSLEEILCMQHINEPRHGKVRFTHSRGSLDGKFPLLILDGSDAFNIISQNGISSNILILLERSEYHENIHNTVLQLKQSTKDITEDVLEYIPSPIPAGLEFISFSVS